MKRDFRMSIHFILFVSPPLHSCTFPYISNCCNPPINFKAFLWVMFINVRFYRKIIFACFNTLFPFILLSLMARLYKSSLIWLSFVRLNTETFVRLNQTCFSVIFFLVQMNQALRSEDLWKMSLKARGQSSGVSSGSTEGLRCLRTRRLWRASVSWLPWVCSWMCASSRG